VLEFEVLDLVLVHVVHERREELLLLLNVLP